MAQATETQLGEIQLAGDLAGDGGAQVGTNPQLTHISGLTPGQYDVADITVDAKGRITAIADASAASIAGLIPNATTSTTGVVSVGDNLYISGCELYAKDASISEAGVVQIGTGIDVDVDGVISVDLGTIPTATETTIGGVIVPTAGHLEVDGSGNISVPLATESSVGVMQVGTGLDVAGGVVSVDLTEVSFPDATTSSKGVMQVGTGLDVSAGVVSVDISEVTLPDATESSKGVMQVGTGLDVAGGVVSVDLTEVSFPDATTSSKGVMQVGTGLDVSAGVISVPDATESSKGVMQVGTGLDVSAGVVSVDASELPDATSSTKGVVQAGDNIDVSAGVISVPDATNGTKGVVLSADTDNITITSGAIDVGSNIPKKDAANTYTKSNSVSAVALTSGTSIELDASLSNTFTLTLDHTGTLSNPSNLVAGQTIVVIITQGTTGGVLSFGTNWKFRAGLTPLLSSGSGKVDVISAVSDGTNLFASFNRNFL